MKKTLQMIGLFFSILFVLAGCSGVTGETFSELDTRVTQTPLFDESDVSIITTLSNSRFEQNMDSQNKTKYDNFAKAHGVSLTWNGTTLISEYSFTNKSVDDFSITNAINLAKNSYVITKRNRAGTRYIIKNKYSNNIYYFAKK